MDLFIWIFLALTLSFWIASWAMFLRFRFVPTVAPPDEEMISGIPVRISIIIPARNEEDNLSRLLPSLASQSVAPHEILVVNDHSTDRTGIVAESHGARVIDGHNLPEGWYGKPWACQQGADAASGDWLLFLDADVVMEEASLRRISALAQEDGTVHSICPYHRVRRLHEELSAFFNVIMLLGMNAFTLKGDAASGIGLFGQAMFLSRRTYDLVGGHSRVRREVLENFHLSRHFREAGVVCRCYLGRGTLSMRMFPGCWRDLVTGWGKGFVSGADNTARSAVVGISIWLSGLIMATIALTFLPLAGTEARFAVGALYLLAALQCVFVFRSAGSFSLFNALLFPVALAFYQLVFFQALRRRKTGGQVQWKGRDVG